jgi:VWFA-related protein
MSKKILFGWCWAAVAAACLADPAPAQPSQSAQSSQKPAQTFAGSVEVVEVAVPVQVVRDGQPVRGLTVADFEIYDGRRKLPVTGFHVVDLAAPAGRGALPLAGRRQFLLLFDLAFSGPKAIVAAREAARGLVLKGMRPGDLVGVAAYSAARGPQVVLGFTSDRRQVDAALDSLGAVRNEKTSDPLRLVMAGVAGSAVKPQAAERSQEADLARTNELLDAQGGQLAGLGKQSTRSNQKAAVVALTRSYADLAHLLASLPGRKQVVYFSEGFDSSFLTGTVGAAAGGAPASATNDAGELQALQQQDRANQDVYLSDSEQSFGSSQSLNGLERMLEEFRRADCVIQAVDVGGLRAGGDQPAGARTTGKDSLLAMARGTGGELFESSNDLAGAMSGILERTSLTYVLSFQPEAQKPDGAYHKLRVELKGAPRGTRIAYRAGYYAPRPYAQLNPLEKLFEASARLMGGEESGSVSGAVLAVPFRNEGGGAGGKAYVPVLIEADGAALLAADAAGRQPKGILPVEVYAYALGAGGAIQDFFFQSLGLDLDKAGTALRQGGLKFVGHLDLAPGEYSVRTLVRSGGSGVFSLRATALTVPAFGQGPALLPALFPDPAANRWVLVREAPRGGAAPPAYPFMARQQPYVPSSRPVLAEGREVPMALVGYDLGAGDLRAAARVLTADGKEAGTGQVRVLQREAASAGGPDRLVAAFRPPKLPPGEYVLRVTVNGAAGPVGASSAPFMVAGAPGAPPGTH